MLLCGTLQQYAFTLMGQKLTRRLRVLLMTALLKQVIVTLHPDCMLRLLLGSQARSVNTLQHHSTVYILLTIVLNQMSVTLWQAAVALQIVAWGILTGNQVAEYVQAIMFWHFSVR
jgi:hypothetical protein